MMMKPLDEFDVESLLDLTHSIQMCLLKLQTAHDCESLIEMIAYDSNEIYTHCREFVTFGAGEEE